MNRDVKAIFARILSDIRVDLSEEFDRNFEREAFFSEAWQRHRSPLRPGGHILVDTGRLRRSITSRTTEDSITFYTNEPYAEIHNDGGEIVVTTRMKRYFWYRYYQATGTFGRRKDGTRRRDKRNLQISSEAEFWQHMALMKVGSVIRIPRRRFLGTSPEVEQTVRGIVEECIQDYFDNEFNITER